MEALTYVVLAMASAMAGKHGLQLIIDPEADTFKTNGTVLIIPPIPKLLKRFESLEALEIYLMGAITHEVGHIKYTDRNERARFNASYATHPERAIAMDVGQIVEDVVIERLLAADNANSAKHLRNMWGMLFARFKALEQKAPFSKVKLPFGENFGRMTMAPDLNKRRTRFRREKGATLAQSARKKGHPDLSGGFQALTGPNFPASKSASRVDRSAPRFTCLD